MKWKGPYFCITTVSVSQSQRPCITNKSELGCLYKLRGLSRTQKSDRVPGTWSSHLSGWILPAAASFSVGTSPLVSSLEDLCLCYTGTPTASIGLFPWAPAYWYTFWSEVSYLEIATSTQAWTLSMQQNGGCPTSWVGSSTRCCIKRICILLSLASGPTLHSEDVSLLGFHFSLRRRRGYVDFVRLDSKARW